MVAVSHRLYPKPEDNAVLRGSVRRRQVIFIQGFFPRGAGYYRAILEREMKAFAALHNLDASCGALQWDKPLHARCRLEIGDAGGDTSGARIDTEYHFLQWQDVIEARLAGGWVQQTRASLRAFYIHLRSGALRAFWQAHWRYAMAVLAPYVFPLIMVIVATLCAIAALSAFSNPSLPSMLAALIAGLTLWGAVFLNRIWRTTLMRANFNACVAAAEGRWPAFDARVAAFADEIDAVINESAADEILIVGHSFGTQLAVLACHDLLRRGSFKGKQNIRLVTLGDVSCHIGLLPGPGAERMRAAAIALGQQDSLPWLSLYSGKDVLCFNTAHTPATFATVDAGHDVGPEDFPWPVMFDAGFRSAMAPKTYARRRLKFFHMHSQFIFAAQMKGAHFDYFRLVCGGAPLNIAPEKTAP